MSAVIKLAEVLPQTSIASLECAACDSAIAPHIATCLHLDMSETLMIIVRSLAGNKMGPDGTAALAEVLPKTKIENLKCAAPEIMR